VRFIDIEEIEGSLPAGWAATAKAALDAVRNAPDLRSATINAHRGVWAGLKELLKQHGNQKCWYCESKDLRSDNAVDHFRPKGNVRDTNPPHDGYWWLAFDWRNYRFCCTFCNSIRTSSQGSGGKQDYFPLHDEAARARLEGDRLAREYPMLIDPAVDGDPDLITFNESGEAIPADRDATSLRYRRAQTSIARYHLNHPDILEARAAYFKELKTWLKEADEELDEAAKGEASARTYAHRSLRSLRTGMRATAEYSAAARSLLWTQHRDSKAAQIALR
jgi:uncharacterized protein (TIGR02646 family)